MPRSTVAAIAPAGAEVLQVVVVRPPTAAVATDGLRPADRPAPAAAPDRGQVVVALSGELDVDAVEALERRVRDVLRAGAEAVVVDLRRLGLLDSTGLRVLLGLRNDAKRRGARLVLVPGPRAVQRTFELTATRGLFEWRASPAGSAEAPGGRTAFRRRHP